VRTYVTALPHAPEATAALFWPRRLMHCVMEWYARPDNRAGLQCDNVSKLFAVLGHYARALDEAMVADVQRIADLVARSPGHAAAYFALVERIGNRQ